MCVERVRQNGINAFVCLRIIKAIKAWTKEIQASSCLSILTNGAALKCGQRVQREREREIYANKTQNC